jgi:agmatinase
MDLVEIAPPYDVADGTAQLGARVIMDVLATLVDAGHLGSRLTREERERQEHERDRAAGVEPERRS